MPQTPTHPPLDAQELAVASREAEALLRSISESTAVAEREKAKVAVIVREVSSKAAEIAAVKVGGRALGGLGMAAVRACAVSLQVASPQPFNRAANVLV